MGWLYCTPKGGALHPSQSAVVLFAHVKIQCIETIYFTLHTKSHADACSTAWAVIRFLSTHYTNHGTLQCTRCLTLGLSKMATV